MHALVRLAMIGSLIAAAVAWWMKDVLPPPAKLAVDLLQEPQQARVRKPPIDTSVTSGSAGRSRIPRRPARPSTPPKSPTTTW